MASLSMSFIRFFRRTGTRLRWRRGVGARPANFREHRKLDSLRRCAPDSVSEERAEKDPGGGVEGFCFFKMVMRQYFGVERRTEFIDGRRPGASRFLLWGEPGREVVFGGWFCR